MGILSGGSSLDLDLESLGDEEGEEDEDAGLGAGVGVGLRIDFGLMAGGFGSGVRVGGLAVAFAAVVFAF